MPCPGRTEPARVGDALIIITRGNLSTGAAVGAKTLALAGFSLARWRSPFRAVRSGRAAAANVQPALDWYCDLEMHRGPQPSSAWAPPVFVAAEV